MKDSLETFIFAKEIVSKGTLEAVLRETVGSTIETVVFIN